MASLLTHLGNRTQLVIELDHRNRLVLNLRCWERTDSRLRQAPFRKPNAWMDLWDFWILWERRKSERHKRDGPSRQTAWLGQATIDVRNGNVMPLVQADLDEDEPEPPAGSGVIDVAELSP